MSQEPTLRQLLQNISRQLDVLTMVLLDLRLATTGLPDETVAISEPLPNRVTDQPLPEPQIMDNGDQRIVRQALPGKHWLIAKLDSTTSDLRSLQIETPAGERYPVTVEQLQEMYPNLVVVPREDVASGTHPTDRSLNPDR